MGETKHRLTADAEALVDVWLRLDPTTAFDARLMRLMRAAMALTDDLAEQLQLVLAVTLTHTWGEDNVWLETQAAVLRGVTLTVQQSPVNWEAIATRLVQEQRGYSLLTLWDEVRRRVEKERLEEARHEH